MPSFHFCCLYPQQTSCLRLFSFIFFPADSAGFQQIISKVVRNIHLVNIAVLQPLLPKENLLDGIEDDLHIAPKGYVPDIFEIGGQLAVPGKGVAPAGLGKAGKACLLYTSPSPRD